MELLGAVAASQLCASGVSMIVDRDRSQLLWCPTIAEEEEEVCIGR